MEHVKDEDERCFADTYDHLHLSGTFSDPICLLTC